jgi:hypothetical protein
LKQQYIKTAVSSALLIFSSLASANNINFTYEADKIIDAELTPLLIKFEQQYGDTNWGNFSTYALEQLPEYHLALRNGYLGDEIGGLKRDIALSEVSNSDVSFTNTNLGLYTEKINQDYINGPFNYRYSQLASFGQNGFTADFSKPVTSVSMDFALNSYFAKTGEDSNWNVDIYRYAEVVGFVQQTPIILNATYRDASGQVIGNSSISTPFNLNLVNGGQLNNPGFSLDASSPFSSIDISWDSGTVSRMEGEGKYDASGIKNEVIYSNLLTANNFTYTQAVAVPEPETYAMMMAGLGMLGFTARRKKINQV